MPIVKIVMTSATVQGLKDSGSFFYALRAVQNSDRAGRPLVWQRRDDFSNETFVAWKPVWEAYTSHSPIRSNAPVYPGFRVRISLGEILEVEESSGSGAVRRGGPPTDISIHNRTGTQLTCGISQAGQDGEAALPYCIFPLYGKNLQEIAPLDKVLLTFSTERLEPGSVIGDRFGTSLRIRDLAGASFTPSILIDCTGVSAREVAYDLNAGWSWGSFTWAESISAGASLVPWLIEPSKGLRGVRA